MKRRAFLCAMLLAALPVQARAERFTRGLLWRVSKTDVAASHVYGTIHVPDPRLAQLPPQVKARLDAARSLMLEFVPDPYSRERFLEAAMFLDRQTLTEKIGAEDFERAFEHLAPTGLSRDVVNKLKPWGVLLNLRNPRRVEHGAALDSQLLELARARRLPLHQIEGVEEQIFTFDEFPMESQVALLKHSLAHREELHELAERTVEAYLARFAFPAGATLTYIGRMEGDRWIMDMQQSPLLPPNERFRTIITKVGTGLRFVEEHSVDGGPWSVTEDYRYRRVR